MNAYVEECRREWKRLGVPDLLAEEMATELEGDLAEAQDDGVSAAEFLGESDPRRFAATWARERGLVSEPPPKKKRRLWIWVLATLATFILFVLLMVALALGAWGSTVSVGPPAPPHRVRSVVIPNFVGMKACHAERIARESLLRVRSFPQSRCNARVIAQGPAPHTLVEWPRGAHTVVKLRLRARR
jgi:hypothetical protein